MREPFDTIIQIKKKITFTSEDNWLLESSKRSYFCESVSMRNDSITSCSQAKSYVGFPITNFKSQLWQVNEDKIGIILKKNPELY